MVFDRDGDGLLTLQEAAMAIRSCGIPVSDQEVQDLPPQVTWQVFHDWMQTKLATHDPERELLKLFATFDRLNNGTVNAQELQEVMKTLSVSLSEDQMRAIMNDADPQNTGTIRYADFVRKLLE